MTVFVVSVLLLLTASMSIRKSSAEYSLDMAENSVDDAYEDCKDGMKNILLTNYSKSETNNTPDFKKAWKNAVNNCPERELNTNQCAAIYLYTEDDRTTKKCSYKEFNKATRDGKAAYMLGHFQFYTLFFFLTDAVQQLKQQQQTECLTVYRRTTDTYQTDVLNKIIRFGSFTSTSLNKDAILFDNKSCFEVETCFGADITKYSAFPHEQAVLIPPYEVFNVTNITTSKEQKDLWCEVVYELKSVDMNSNLNCAKVRP